MGRDVNVNANNLAAGTWKPTFDMTSVDNTHLHKVFRLCLYDWDTNYATGVWYDLSFVKGLFSDIQAIDPASGTDGAAIGVPYPRTGGTTSLSFNSAATANFESGGDKLQPGVIRTYYVSLEMRRAALYLLQRENAADLRIT